MDIKTKEQRSYNMSHVRSKNTKPELVMFEILEEYGLKFKKHYSTLGKPDIAFPSLKVAVFINGEFWHGKDFNNMKNKIPKFWKRKIQTNMTRDRRVRSELRRRNWHVINFWGRRVVKNPEMAFRRLEKFLERIKSLT